MAVDFGPTDHFGIETDGALILQSSTDNDEETSAIMLDSAGNKEAETTGLDTLTRYTATYRYEGSDLATDVTTEDGIYSTNFGDTVNTTAKVDEVTFHFEAGQYPTVTVSGHQHAENAHVSGTPDGDADCTGIFPAATGFGVPTLAGQVDGTDASPISLDVTLRCTHVDRVGGAGNHLCGQSITFMAEVTETWVGVPTTPEATNWITDSVGDTGNEQNEDFTEFTYTAHRYFDAN